jgi:hypothetical protein
MKRDAVGIETERTAENVRAPTEINSCKNPPLICRQVSVGVVYAVLCCIAGLMVGLFVGHYIILAVVGFLIGATTGAWMERGD